jgi:CBS domain-containing protein
MKGCKANGKHHKQKFGKGVKLLFAKDIMTESVAVIYEDMLIRQVAHLMFRDRVSGFPVVNKKVGLVGIITITDLFAMINKAADHSSWEDFNAIIDRLKDVRVADIMTQETVTIQPDTSMDEIVQLLTQDHIHFFPVVQEGQMVGVVSRHDILNAIFSFE